MAAIRTFSHIFFCVFFLSLVLIHGFPSDTPDERNDVDTTTSLADTDAFVTDSSLIKSASSSLHVTGVDGTVDVSPTRISPDPEKGQPHHNGTFEPETGLHVSFQLPTNWEKLCDIHGTELFSSEFTAETELLVIKCNVPLTSSNVISARDLNDVINGTNGVKLSLTIQCFGYATVSISWPIKIRNLYKISVKDCRINDYYADFNSKVLDTIPDSLRVLDYRNVIIMFPLSSFTEMLTKVDEFSKEYNCGHEETVEVLAMVNQTEDFIMDMTDIPDILLASEEYMRDSRRISHTCDFKHLMVIDESLSDSQSTYKMQTLIQHSIFDQLRVFNQSHSFIKSIKEPILHWSVHFPLLETFDLSWNNISGLYRFEIPVQAASPDRVTTINLQHNNISMITLDQLQRLTLMPSVFLDLRHNPIDCTCSEDIEQLLEYIHAKRHRNISKMANYSYFEELQCATPSHLKGRPLGTLQITDACPVETSTEYFVAPIIVLVASIVILVLLLVLVLRYRQDIQIILFTRFDIIVPCQSRVAGPDKQYDAFVSYSSNDEDWIEAFFEQLEKKPLNHGSRNFKFCMHHRDFIPGKTIFDNVINSVESSRHTIILLSKHYLGSEFCLYEFQEAFRQSVMEQKRHLIIVMMEDIPETDLPRDLKRCIKTFTYIRKDDSLFAQRLMFALTIKHKSKQVSMDKDFNSDLATPSPNKRSKQSSNSKLSINGVSKISKFLTTKSEETSHSPTNTNMVQLHDIVKRASSNNGMSNSNLAFVSETAEYELNDLGKSSTIRNDTGSESKKTVHNENNLGNSSTIENTTKSKSQETVHNENDLGKPNTIENTSKSQTQETVHHENEHSKAPTRAPLKQLNHADQIDSFSKYILDSRHCHVDYDRSISCLSADTGYGSDRGSYNDRNTPCICESP